MNKAVIFLPVTGVVIVATIACAPDPPVVGISDSYTPYSQASQRQGAYGISHVKPGSWDPAKGQPFGAAGTRTAAAYGIPGQDPWAGYQAPTEFNPLTATRPSGIPQPGFQVPPRSVSATRPTVVQPQPAVSRPSPSRTSGPRQSLSSLLREVKVRRDFIPYRARGRTRKSMRPRYITIHSTQNWSRGADAIRHGKAMRNSKLGRKSWHYTVDERLAVQHIPTTEQGNHADYDGPGNRYSIGIEMCEHPGNSRERTLERTAKLTAWLMEKHDIPISRVVPHYKWPRWGKKPPNKNCPHFLMTNGRPGKKWERFKDRVRRHHLKIR